MTNTDIPVLDCFATLEEITRERTDFSQRVKGKVWGDLTVEEEEEAFRLGYYGAILKMPTARALSHLDSDQGTIVELIQRQEDFYSRWGAQEWTANKNGESEKYQGVRFPVLTL